MKRHLKNNLFTLEKLLIFIAFLCFSFSIFCKYKAENKFQYVNKKLNFIQLEYYPILTFDYKNKLALELERDFLPFTKYNYELESEINNIVKILFDSEASDDSYKSLMKSLVNAHTILIETQQKFSFGYDTILYASIIIFSIALFLISKKNKEKEKEIILLSTRNETQLKISRDLHDGVAQDLAAVKLYLQNGEIEKSKYYANQALQEVRYLIGAMHLDLTKGFEEIIQQTLLVFETNYEIKTHFYNGSSYIDKLNIDSQIELLRILQEALSNISKHSQATEITLKITDSGNDFRFIISDNGIGFSDDKLNKKQDTIETHYGLNNIKERAKALGGTVDFINDGGTTIAICIKNIIR